MPEPLDLEALFTMANEAIMDHGYMVHYDDSRSPAYRNIPRAFTVGRVVWLRPELMMSGPFTEEQMTHFLDEAIHHDNKAGLRAESRLTIGGRAFVAVEAAREAFVLSAGMFGGQPGLQLVWLDEHGQPGPAQVIRAPEPEDEP